MPPETVVAVAARLSVTTDARRAPIAPSRSCAVTAWTITRTISWRARPNRGLTAGYELVVVTEQRLGF